MDSKIEKVLNEYKEGNISVFLAIRRLESLTNAARKEKELLRRLK